jgi:hypothetical protein
VEREKTVAIQMDDLLQVVVDEGGSDLARQQGDRALSLVMLIQLKRRNGGEVEGIQDRETEAEEERHHDGDGAPARDESGAVDVEQRLGPPRRIEKRGVDLGTPLTLERRPDHVAFALLHLTRAHGGVHTHAHEHDRAHTDRYYHG